MSVCNGSGIWTEKGDARRYVVTGGAGYAGYKLAQELVSRGSRVVILDVNPPASRHEHITFIKADIRNYDSVRQAFTQDIDGVFHVASYGMSGKEQVNQLLIKQINVDGTKNVVRACKEYSVPALVYTSTCNVVFSGQPIYDGKEDMDYCKPEQYLDEYSKTKASAERLVLQANGTPLAVGGTLRTVALRSAGIYGVGEKRIFPRSLNAMRAGVFIFHLGSGEAKMDYIHIDNFVDVHIKAECALRHNASCGEVFNISDGAPINYYHFVTPFTLALGFSLPKIRIPAPLVLLIGMMTEFIYSRTWRWCDFEPLTLMETSKLVIHHSFCIDKARRELAYDPRKVNDTSDIIRHYQDQGCAAKSYTALFKSSISMGHIRANSLYRVFIMILLVGLGIFTVMV